MVGDGILLDDPSTKSFGHFELIDRVGIGQFGSVWKARDTKLDRTVAMLVADVGKKNDSKDCAAYLRD